MSRPTPGWLAAFRAAYRERLGRMAERRAAGWSWDAVKGEMEPEDARLAGQGPTRWRNEWWLAKRDGAVG